MALFLLVIASLTALLLANGLSLLTKIVLLFHIPGWLNLGIVLGILAWFIADEH